MIHKNRCAFLERSPLCTNLLIIPLWYRISPAPPRSPPAISRLPDPAGTPMTACGLGPLSPTGQARCWPWWARHFFWSGPPGLEDWIKFSAFLVYGLSMIGLYTASTLYHCVNTTVRGRLACGNMTTAPSTC